MSKLFIEQFYNVDIQEQLYYVYSGILKYVVHYLLSDKKWNSLIIIDNGDTGKLCCTYII